MMKKVVLSAAVVFTFLAYALHQQQEGASAVGNVVPPTPSQNTNAAPISANSTITTASTYKDGKYTGDSTDAFYGNVQVQAVISGGKISDVIFLDHPHDRQTSEEINQQAMPFLKQEAIAAQSANVDIISGATQTSQAFRISLASALAKAK